MKLNKQQVKALAEEVLCNIRKKNQEIKEKAVVKYTTEELKAIDNIASAIDILNAASDTLDIEFKLHKPYTARSIKTARDKEETLESIEKDILDKKVSKLLHHIPALSEVERKITLLTIEEDTNIQEVINILVEEFTTND